MSSWGLETSQTLGYFFNSIDERTGRATVKRIWPVIVSPDTPGWVWAFGRAIDGGPQAALPAPRGRWRGAV
eukprot:46452-Pleurochrysis_carterae.AAC.1